MTTGDTKRLFEPHCLDIEIEYLPFALYNQKKRPHYADCWVINPLGALDCLHSRKSEITWLDDIIDGEVIGLGKIVLDKKKPKSAPQLFRIKEDPATYVLGERLVEDLKRNKCTNLVLEELEVA